jgi:hypothetical protein
VSYVETIELGKDDKSVDSKADLARELEKARVGAVLGGLDTY